MKQKLKVVLLTEDAKAPVYSTEQAAGMDLHSTEEAIVFPDSVVGYDSEGNEVKVTAEEAVRWGIKRHPVVIGTGVKVEIPEDCELEIRGRSGLTFNYGLVEEDVEIKYDIVPFNGTLDSDYRGELKLKIWNLGTAPFRIETGMRVAQGVMKRVITKKDVDIEITEEISVTERGEGRFGHTGLK